MIYIHIHEKSLVNATCTVNGEQRKKNNWISKTHVLHLGRGNLHFLVQLYHLTSTTEMPPKKRKNKKAPQPLDLSVSASTETDKQFSVESYDYAELQTEKSSAEIQFEDDLKFLMSGGVDLESAIPSLIVESKPLARSKPSKPKKSKKMPAKSVKLSLKEITGDIDDITFSSDDEDVAENKDSERLKAPKQKGSKKVKETPRIDIGSSGNGDQKPNVTKSSSKQNGKTSKANPAPKEKTPKKKKKKAATSEPAPDLELQEENKDSTLIAGNDEDSSENVAVVPELTAKQLLKIEKRKEKMKERRKLKKEQKKAQAKAAEAESGDVEPATGDSGKSLPENGNSDPVELNGSHQTTSSSEFSPTPEPETKSPTSANVKKELAPLVKLRSSAAALATRQLPEIHPVKTFIGVSHQQIMLMREADVKYKTIMTAPLISKLARNALRFLSRDDVFGDNDKKTQFLHLCVLVALHESNGFHNICRKYSGLETWLSQFKELTLEHTRTNLTVSAKPAHTNNLDYNVFSYLGHILVWANYLQTAGGCLTVMEKFAIDVTRKDILASIGGFHLWDRVRRDERTINTKRWKHIQKFRQIFAFEEDQFVLILRLMDLGLEVP